MRFNLFGVLAVLCTLTLATSQDAVPKAVEKPDTLVNEQTFVQSTLSLEELEQVEAGAEKFEFQAEVTR